MPDTSQQLRAKGSERETQDSLLLHLAEGNKITIHHPLIIATSCQVASPKKATKKGEICFCV